MNAWLPFINLVSYLIVFVIGGLAVRMWPLMMQSRAQKEALARAKELQEETLLRAKELQDAKIRMDERLQINREIQDLLDRSNADAKRRDEYHQRLEHRLEDFINQIRDLTISHADCLVKNERLLARLAVTEATIKSIQTVQSISDLPTRNEALIVVDDHGVIREWNQAAVILFHWKTHEAVGRDVTMLVPQEYLDAHLRARAEVISGKRSARRGPYYLFGLTKTGTRIPIEMVLSSWCDTSHPEHPRVFVSAAIRQRLVDADGSPVEEPIEPSRVVANDESAPLTIEPTETGGAVVSVPSGASVSVSEDDLKIEVKTAETSPECQPEEQRQPPTQ